MPQHTSPEHTSPGPPGAGRPASALTVVHEYRFAYNAVVEPDKYVACSRYFLRRWVPTLGPVGACIVLALRSLGYYNPGTGERRDGIEIDLPGLAALAGVSIATLKREFGGKTGQPGRRRNPALHQFVQKESQYSRDATTGIVLRRRNVYRVMMDDPIHPLDADRLQAALDAREKGDPRKARNEPYGVPRMAQNEPPVAHSEPPPAQNALPLAQNAPALQDYSNLFEKTPETFNVRPPSSEGGPAPEGGGGARTSNVPPEGRKTLLRRDEAARLAQRAVTLTKDEKSRRRYEQLAGLCRSHGALSLWETAYTVTEARMTKSGSPPASPGAYFCGVLKALFQDEGLYMPVGTPAERASIRAQIAQSFAQADAARIARTDAGGRT